MIPLGDVIPWRRPPIITLGIMVVTAGLFAVLLALDEPRRLVLERATALIPEAARPASRFTSLFLQAGALDLVANLAALWIFGTSVEDRLGRGRYLLFFLLCGLASGVARVLADAESPLPIAGQAGAVAGVLGGYFTLFPRSQVLVLLPLPTLRIDEVPATYVLGGWFALQIIEATLLPGGPVTRAALLLALAVGFGSGAAAVVALGGKRGQSEYWKEG